MNIVFSFLLISLVSAVLLGFFRLVKGPHTLDKALSLDFIGIAAIAIIASLTIYFEEPMILDLGLLLALVSFVTALAFSKYFTEKEKK